MFDEEYARAYEISSKHYLETGDTYAVLEWLSGYLALEKLKNTELALKHFKNFLLSVDAPISLGRVFIGLEELMNSKAKWILQNKSIK